MKIVNTFKLFLLMGLFLTVCSCQKQQENKTNRGQVHCVDNFENVLDISFTPVKPYDIKHTLFSDQGAWHAYAVPSDSRYYGGFTGPMVMSMYGEWLSKGFAQWNIIEDNQSLDWSKSIRSVRYLPGSIVQTYLLDGLDIEQTLVFSDHRTSMIRTVFKNEGNKARNLNLTLSGTLWSSKQTISSNSRGEMVVNIKDHHSYLVQDVVPMSDNLKISTQDSSYVMRWNHQKVKRNDSLVFVMTQHYQFKEEPRYSYHKDFTVMETENQKRWNGYLCKYFNRESRLLKDTSNIKIAVKSIMTLVTNYRSKAGDLKHAGTFPSVSYQGFYGFWSWDSWKHAVAYSYFEPQMAKDNLRSMFDYQDDRGMVADCIYYNSKENNWRDTKPPLAAWAVAKIFDATKDTSFVEEMLPRLIKYHHWWYTDRDHDNNGLCEYGSTDGTRIAAAWESGMDNAVRFDHAEMIQNRDKAWSLDQESVDLNCYLYYDKKMISYLENVLQIKKPSLTAIGTSDLRTMIRQLMFDKEEGFYFDIDLEKKKQIPIYGPEGWIPLWSEVATKEEAISIVKNIMDTTKFNTYIPCPTLDASHPKFNPLKGYWRGPVWLDQAYFAIKGMYKYGYDDKAIVLTENIMNHCQGLKDRAPIRENYHPITGEGLNAIGFSWSSAHLLMLLRESK
ncbi:hypothetical protein K5X82_04110 [Halosquirtibacter xylanolyticus]|uniref:MGH1-like glycoside hydrolase domain-containing protein n=1 Tax=Halosquirtibacter xylanolyticus TaxID=3374599 RepID=UPI003748478A|nr:hypothetical protein K5X82_04110 [Prolixibacteraceae bacterium]